MGKTEGSYNIKAVVALTGLPADTLRAWERRYGVVAPERTDTGRRLYSKADVARLSLLADAVRLGHAISTIAGLDDAALTELNEQPRADGGRKPAGLDASVTAALDAIDAYDSEQCESTLAMALSAMPVASAIDDLLMPLLVEAGERWSRGRFTIAQERLISAIVRRLALNLLTTLSASARQPRIVFGTLPGEDHEFGALFGALTVAAMGVSCEYLGTDLPGSEFARIAKQRGVSVVGLSAVREPVPASAASELSALIRALPKSTEVWLGGAAASALLKGAAKKRVLKISSLAELRRHARLLT